MIKSFKNLNPKTRLWLTRGIIIVFLIFLGIPIYKNLTKKHHLEKKEKYQVLDNDPSTFEKTLLARTEGELEKMRNQISALTKSLDEATRKNNAVKSNPENSDLNDANGGPNDSSGGLSDIERKKQEIADRLLQSRKAQERAARQQIFKPNLAGVTPGEQSATKTKKPAIRTVKFTPLDHHEKQRKITLPPSFMDASLLSGVLAPTGQVSDNHPIPMLIRIKDLAILPNEVKQDLKGCFVVAEGQGGN